MMSPSLRIGLLSDTHLRDPGVEPVWPATWAYPLALEKARWAADLFTGKLDAPPRDLVVAAGDLIDGYCPNAHYDLEHLRRFLDQHLPIPLLACLGNHENIDGTDHAATRRFLDITGAPSPNYWRDIAGVRFVVLDTSDSLHDPSPGTQTRTAFLDHALSQAAIDGLPVIVVSHVPLLPMREEEIYRQSFGWRTYKLLDPQALEVLDRHEERVIAVLSGHIHLTGVVERRGVLHIVSAGTSTYPADVALIDLHEDRLDLTMRSAPPHLLCREGNMHGHERHGRDFTDSDHPDPESYLWGTQDERLASWPLTGFRRPAPHPTDL